MAITIEAVKRSEFANILCLSYIIIFCMGESMVLKV